MRNDARYFQYMLDQVLELMSLAEMNDHPKAQKLVKAAIRTSNPRLLEYVAKKLSPIVGRRKLEATKFDPLPKPEDLQGELSIGVIDE